MKLNMALNLFKDKLVSYEEWSSHIDNIQNSIGKEISDEEQAVLFLGRQIKQSFNKNLSGRFAILLSGGVDSALLTFLAKKHNADFVCYTVGLENAPDIIYARKFAQDFKINHKIKILTLKELEVLFEKTAQILEQNLNIINLGVGAVEIAAIELSLKDNINIVMSGLGSEEIFAGYQRHSLSKNINKECWSGLKTTWKRDFQREYLIGKHYNVELRAPFLDKDLIMAAMSISGSLKIKDNYKKYILRKAALKLGLPEEYSLRPKKAAQYGSSVDKALMKITKQKGLRYKREYLDYLREHK
jgi:asparagine synthase (glutamine-hydrolysing)